MDDKRECAREAHATSGHELGQRADGDVDRHNASDGVRDGEAKEAERAEPADDEYGADE